MELPAGERLSLEAVDHYVLVTVVNDRSVPWIYGLLAIGLMSSGIALLIPVRRVVVTASSSGQTIVMKAVVAHSRKSPAFAAQVREAIGCSADGGTQEGET